jgi:hypothetical protein
METFNVTKVSTPFFSRSYLFITAFRRFFRVPLFINQLMYVERQAAF